jgi:hypothetical protein
MAAGLLILFSGGRKMRTTILVSALSTALLAAGAYAQDKRDPSQTSIEKSQQTTTTTSTGTFKGKTETVIGEVKSFQPGKSIEVSVPGKIIKNRTFDLDASDTVAKVDSAVAVGSRVKVTMKTDNNGHKTVNVEPHSGN